MKVRLFLFLLAFMAFDCPKMLAQKPDGSNAQRSTEEERSKLSYEIFQAAGIFAGVNQDNYGEARVLAEKLTEIKNERINSATARGVSLGYAELKALVRVRYIQLNANNQTLNAIENAAYKQFISSNEKDLAIVAEVARSIPPHPADAFLANVEARKQLMGMQRVEQITQSQQAVENQALASGPKIGAPLGNTQAVYVSKINSNQGDVLVLDNGAVVEITFGFLGFVGFRKDAVLFRDQGSWMIWIEDKKKFRCDVLKAPTPPALSGQGEIISISDVKGDGYILTSIDGTIFEVGDVHTTTTSLWLGPFEALLIDGTKLLNLEDGGEIIDVSRLR